MIFVDTKIGVVEEAKLAYIQHFGVWLDFLLRIRRVIPAKKNHLTNVNKFNFVYARIPKFDCLHTLVWRRQSARTPI